MDFDLLRSPTTATDRSCPKTPNSCLKKNAGDDGREFKRRRRVSFAADADIQQVRVFVPQPAASSSDELLSSVREDQDQDTTHQQATPKFMLNDENAENLVPQQQLALGKPAEPAAASPAQKPAARQLQEAAPVPLLSPVAQRPRLPLSTLSPVAGDMTDTTMNTASICLDPKVLNYDPAAAAEDSINFGSLARREDYYQEAPEPEPPVQQRRRSSRRSSIVPTDSVSPLEDSSWESLPGTTELQPLKEFLQAAVEPTALDGNDDDDTGLLAEIDAMNDMQTTFAGHHSTGSLRRASPSTVLDTQALLASSTQELDVEPGHTQYNQMQHFSQLQQHNRLQLELQLQQQQQQQQEEQYHDDTPDDLAALDVVHNQTTLLDNTVRLLEDNTEPIFQLVQQAGSQDLAAERHRPAGTASQPELEEEHAEEPPADGRGELQFDAAQEEVEEAAVREAAEEDATPEPEHSEDGAGPAPSLQEVYEFLKDECSYPRPLLVHRGKSMAAPPQDIEDYHDALLAQFKDAPLDKAYGKLWPAWSQLVDELKVENQELEAAVLKSAFFRTFWKLDSENRKEQLVPLVNWARLQTKVHTEHLQAKEYEVLCAVLRQMDQELSARTQLKVRQAAVMEPCSLSEALRVKAKCNELYQEQIEELEEQLLRLQARNAEIIEAAQQELPQDAQLQEALAEENALLEALQELELEEEQEDMDEEVLRQARQEAQDMQFWLGTWMKPASLGEGRAFWHGAHNLVECVVYEDSDADLVHACGLLHPENGPREQDGTDPLPHVNTLLKDLLHVWSDHLEPLAVSAPPTFFWAALHPLRRTLRDMALFLRELVRGLAPLPGLHAAAVDRPAAQLRLTFLFPSPVHPPAHPDAMDHTVELVFPVEALLNPGVLQTQPPQLVNYRKWYTVSEQDVLFAFWDAVQAGPLLLSKICSRMEACFVQAGVCLPAASEAGRA